MSGGARGGSAANDWTDVAATVDIEPGGFAVIELDDARVAVFNVDGEFYALEDLCSHDHACLTDGEVDGSEVICPIHGARFDIRTGDALTPPAYEPVSRFPVRVNEGIVQVRDDRDD